MSVVKERSASGNNATFHHLLFVSGSSIWNRLSRNVAHPIHWLASHIQGQSSGIPLWLEQDGWQSGLQQLFSLISGHHQS